MRGTHLGVPRLPALWARSVEDLTAQHASYRRAPAHREFEDAERVLEDAFREDAKR